MLGRYALVLVTALLVLTGCGGGETETSEDGLAGSVEPHLRYLDRESSAVFVVDVRYEGRNWEHVRDIVSRALRAYREQLEPDDQTQIPPNLTGALNLVAGYAGLSFEEDIEPLLDGRLVVGLVQPPVPPLPPDAAALRRKPAAELTPQEQQRLFDARDKQGRAAEPQAVWVYRTEADGLREVAEKVAEGEKFKPLEGRDDVLTLDNVALVGDDTVVLTDDERRLAEVLEAAEQEGAGFPASRIADAEKAVGLDDPLLLAAGDRNVARAWVDEPSLKRAFAEVPWLAATRAVAGGLRLDERGGDLALTVSTDPRALGEEDLPLAPAGDLDLPSSDAITGASRDQSVTTTFLSRTARALFADSDFAGAAERAERDLGASFEDEVLRQFSCPSLSRFEPESRRFAARSCVKDPERMRELLPRLSKHLPRILTTLQRLDTQGLVGLLLIAPDAPLTPSFTALADIVVKPFRGGGGDEELLYEVSGLREDFGELARSGPDRVVFGLIGEAFVVASDREMAREAAALEGERLEGPAASAIRVPGSALPDTAPETAALNSVLEEIVVTASADRSALRARGRLELAD